MTETIELILTKFTPEVITISVLALLFVLALVIFYLLYNRRKFHQLKHQIPASVVKNYLDSIIQNSMSLKSSLFRGGGADIGEGIPSVIPVGSLAGGQAISGGASQEELNQKNAEIARLRSDVSRQQQVISDLEGQLNSLRAAGDSNESAKEIQKLQSEIVELKKQLEAAKAAGSTPAGDPEMEKKLQAVTKERDELKERLMEYEIIEEDLANLKRLQQENAQLKKSLEALKSGGSLPEEDSAANIEEDSASQSAPTPEEAAEAVPEPDTDLASEQEVETSPEEDSTPVAEPAKEEAAEPAAAAPEQAPEAAAETMEEDQKSAEELLSEFEKMLG